MTVSVVVVVSSTFAIAVVAAASLAVVVAFVHGVIAISGSSGYYCR